MLVCPKCGYKIPRHTILDEYYWEANGCPRCGYPKYIRVFRINSNTYKVIKDRKYIIKVRNINELIEKLR